MRCILSFLLSFTLLFSSLQPASPSGTESGTENGTEAGTETGAQPQTGTEAGTENGTAATAEISVFAPSVVLMEASTGQVIYEKEPDMLRHPASITKIMTMILIFDALEEGKISLEDTVTVSEYAASMGGSQVFLEPGETQTVDTMLKCISVASANDACAAYRIGNARFPLSMAGMPLPASGNLRSLIPAAVFPWIPELIINRQFPIRSDLYPVDQL